MQGVKPYISFAGNCEEAINFYKDKLGAEVLFLGRYGESPMADKAPGQGDKIMHCSFKIGDSVVMACDNVFENQNPTIVGNNVTLALGTDDAESAERTFADMSDGAKIIMPIQETFWAERFGMLSDKFGIIWMINCDKPESEHAKATA